MAEAQESKDTPALQGSNNNTPVVAFCTPKDGIRVMKRPREDGPFLANASDDAEPDEKRPSFRLNPPTLIHGQAKSIPKEEENTESTQKRSFLRPSTLSAPAACSITAAHTFSSADSKATTSITQAPLLGSGLLLTGQVPSSNPFLKTAEEEEKEPKDQLLFQNTIENRIKENGAEPGGNGGAAGGEEVNGTKENVFLQMSNQAEPAPGVKAADGEFVFGSKMEERVVKNEADSTSETAPQSLEEKQESSKFLFGQNLSDRVKVTTADSTNNLFSTQPAESVIFHEAQAASVSDVVSSSTGNRNLEEDAAALFAASNTKPVMPEVEVRTGEEDEKNVLQIQCKLFQYDASTQNWAERGRGNLRLNDKRLSAASDHVFQSRLVMRTHGSFRLVLNTKIWASMIVDRASQKSVRISAQNEDGDIGVYLIMATINDAEQIYRAVEYRVLHLKQLEERKKLSHRISEASDQGGSPEVTAEQTESDSGNRQTAAVSSTGTESHRQEDREETNSATKTNEPNSGDEVASGSENKTGHCTDDKGTDPTHKTSSEAEPEREHSNADPSPKTETSSDACTEAREGAEKN